MWWFQPDLAFALGNFLNGLFEDGDNFYPPMEGEILEKTAIARERV